MRYFLLFVAILGLPAGAFADILYAIDDSNNSLVTFNTSTNAIAVVGSTGVGTGDFGDLTYDSNHGVMYWDAGRGNNSIYILNLTTGAATLVGATGLTDLFGLAYDTANNTLYGATASLGGENFYSINTLTGAATLIGNSGIYTGGLAYNSTDNTMYETDPTTRSLYSINLGNGAATLFSSGAGSFNDDGITWDPALGVFLVDDYSNNVYQYNAAFTSRNLLTTYTDPLDGIAYVGSAVPEPASVLLTTMVLALGLVARKRISRR